MKIGALKRPWKVLRAEVGGRPLKNFTFEDNLMADGYKNFTFEDNLGADRYKNFNLVAVHNKNLANL